MKWPKDSTLSADQTAHSVLWHSRLLSNELPPSLSKIDHIWCLNFWGDEKSTQRLKTFGHLDPTDRTSPHFVCTRGGTPMHTDPGYTRYALQIQLYNDGFVVHGLEDKFEAMPLFTPGLVILLDTWSPHQVSRDPRLPNTGINKILAGADFAKKPDIDLELPKLINRVFTYLWIS